MIFISVEGSNALPSEKPPKFWVCQQFKPRQKPNKFMRNFQNEHLDHFGLIQQMRIFAPDLIIFLSFYSAFYKQSMSFQTTKEELIGIISAYQQRSYAQDIDRLLEKGENVEWLLRALLSDQRQGISNAQEDLNTRREYFGNNEKQVKEPPGFLALMLEALDDFILKILLLAACFSIGLEVGVAAPEDRTTAWIEGFAILIAVFVCATVTAVNNYQKQRQFLKLNSVADEKKRATVWRNGLPLEIHQDFVLVGDVISINEGMEIPADGILIESNDIATDESAMTGQTQPVAKNILIFCERRRQDLLRNQEINEEDKHQIPSPIIMSGTRVLAGEGKMVVLVVGPQSCLGKIRALLEKDDDEQTPLQQKLEEIANDIGKFGLYSAIFIVVILLIRLAIVVGSSKNWETGRDLVKILHFFIIGITVIVVAIPEGLPLSVTLSLAFSVKKMLEDQNLVRRMQACETMGGANNICSDKTGTLTMNKMVLTEIWNGKTIKVDTYAQATQESSLSLNPRFIELFKISSLVNSTALLYPEQKGSSTEISLLKYFAKMGVNYEDLRNKHPTKLKFPFNSARKRMSVIVTLDEYEHLFIKGASQIVLKSCRYWFNSETNEVQELTSAKIQHIQDVIVSMATKSLRTLCLGYKKLDFKDDLTIKDEKNVYEIEKANNILIAVIGVRDNPRKEVPDAIRQCHLAGITVRMVTGDNIITAKAIAKEIGLMKDQDSSIAMEGPDFSHLVGGIVCKACKTAICDCPTNADDAKEKKKDLRVDTIANAEEFDKIVDKLIVLARSRPEDKYCLVTGLKERGNVVAVTGDGTNDAPALKKADVGFAMGICGTQVARQAAAIILIDDNFSSIVKAVLWGRNIYDSIRKFIQFQLTVNVVAVVCTLIGAALLEKEVLKPIQMLWINLIMDTLASLALATQDPHEHLLLNKPHSRSDYIISKSMMKHIIGQALFQITIMMILIFMGETFIPEETDSLDSQATFISHPEYKWLNGKIGGTVCSGRFHTISGGEDYQKAFKETKIYSRHFTFVFNTFVMMQVFNFINARKIREEFNVFQGMTKNVLFPIIVVGIFVLQIILVTFSGLAFGVYSNYGLTVKQWFISIGFGSLSLIVGLLLKLPKLLPCGDKATQKVEPMKTQPNISDESNNKAVELRIEQKVEFFEEKNQDSSFG